jgi:hypothetical protein
MSVGSALIDAAVLISIACVLLLIVRVLQLHVARRRYVERAGADIVYDEWGVLFRKAPFLRTSARISLTPTELRISGVLMNRLFTRTETTAVELHEADAIAWKPNVSIRTRDGDVRFWWFDVPGLAKHLPRSAGPHDSVGAVQLAAAPDTRRPFGPFHAG